jgi:hypothetical protein
LTKFATANRRRKPSPRPSVPEEEGKKGTVPVLPRQQHSPPLPAGPNGRIGCPRDGTSRSRVGGDLHAIAVCSLLQAGFLFLQVRHGPRSSGPARHPAWCDSRVGPVAALAHVRLAEWKPVIFSRRRLGSRSTEHLCVSPPKRKQERGVHPAFRINVTVKAGGPYRGRTQAQGGLGFPRAASTPPCLTSARAPQARRNGRGFSSLSRGVGGRGSSSNGQCGACQRRPVPKGWGTRCADAWAPLLKEKDAVAR